MAWSSPKIQKQIAEFFGGMGISRGGQRRHPPLKTNFQLRVTP
jgi:hypothetical protein